jgi:hypothetical protein
MSTSLYRSVALAASRIAAARSSTAAAAGPPSRVTRRGFVASHSPASAAAATPATPAAPQPATPAPTPAVTNASASSPTPVAPAPRLRPAVTSAQIRAQRPRATSKVAGNPDSALDTDKCGPEQVAPEMVSVVNEKTGERMGPRGLEPTRFGDWEAKGRCWDF